MSQKPPEKQLTATYVRNMRRVIEQDIHNILSKAENDCSSLRQFLGELKKNCPHDWTYIPDPSGNNDSEYHCSLCDKYSKYGE